MAKLINERLDKLITIESVRLVDYSVGFLQPSDVAIHVDLIFNAKKFSVLLMSLELKPFATLHLSPYAPGSEISSDISDEACELEIFDDEISCYLVGVTGAERLWKDYIISELRKD